ncbi:MAG TPA: hypothetical protein PK649_01895 [Vicingus sp.]|nr:hypothetical protein [Vicingus sp.]HRP59908.1 hypothetical protein [Vicingus sp.]
MEYLNQLNTLYWKIRRQNIIDRDNNVCQKCENKTYINTFKKHYPIEFVNPKIELSEFISIDKYEDGFQEVLSFEILPFNEKDIFRFYASFFDKNKYPTHNEIFEYKNLVLFYTENNEKINGIGIYNAENDNWIYLKDLHVHHKYYQIGRLAWEYPDDAYDTLCWSCHIKTHENSLIDVYDEQGDKIGTKKCCPRCGGAGYFPEYYHIERGVCFSCRGERFL